MKKGRPLSRSREKRSVVRRLLYDREMTVEKEDDTVSYRKGRRERRKKKTWLVRSVAPLSGERTAPILMSKSLREKSGHQSRGRAVVNLLTGDKRRKRWLRRRRTIRGSVPFASPELEERGYSGERGITLLGKRREQKRGGRRYGFRFPI